VIGISSRRVFMNDLHEMGTQLVHKEVAELSEMELETVASGKYGYPVVAVGFRRVYRY
jgi:hypothetical protein